MADPAPQTIDPVALYTKFVNVALKRGVFNSLEETEAINLSMTKIKNDKIDREVHAHSRQMFDRMLTGGVVANVDEASLVLGMLNFINGKVPAESMPPPPTKVPNVEDESPLLEEVEETDAKTVDVKTSTD